MGFTLSKENETIVDQLIGRYPTKAAACIPVLHLCQRENGWVSPDVVKFVADRLEMPASEVRGVATFYTMYHQRPAGKHTIWVCQTLSCELRGARTLQEHLEKRLGCHAGETSEDGTFTLKTAECLAACGYAPMIQVDDLFYENLTVEKLDAILDALQRGEMPPQFETPWYPHDGSEHPAVPVGGAAPARQAPARPSSVASRREPSSPPIAAPAPIAAAPAAPPAPKTREPAEDAPKKTLSAHPPPPVDPPTSTGGSSPAISTATGRPSSVPPLGATASGRPLSAPPGTTASGRPLSNTPGSPVATTASGRPLSAAPALISSRPGTTASGRPLGTIPSMNPPPPKTPSSTTTSSESDGSDDGSESNT